MIKKIIKRLLRILSSWMVVAPDCYLYVGEVDDIGRAKVAHFFKFEPASRVVHATGILKAGTARDGNATTGWERLRIVLGGRLLVNSDQRGWLVLQRLLPRKIFIVSYKEHFPGSSWRYVDCLSGVPKRRRQAAVEPRGGSVIVLGNGPSAQLVLNPEFESLPIICCNSAIKSKALLRRKLFAHCVSDTTFYLGSSPYTAKFHEDFAAVMGATEHPVYCDERHIAFLKHLAPQERLHGVRMDVDVPLRSDFRDGFYEQHGTNNVLTLLMLPLACTFFERVVLIGFDGKGKTVNYFWKHSDEFQYQDLLPTVREHDPAFFRDVDFNRYSLSHEEYLTKMLRMAEAKGVAFSMPHPTNIECLKRYVQS